MNVSDEMKKLLSEPDEIRLDSIPIGFFNRVQDALEAKNAINAELLEALRKCATVLQSGMTNIGQKQSARIHAKKIIAKARGLIK